MKKLGLVYELIEKEKLERTGKLEIGNCSLTELPDELFSLVWLEELIISNRYWDYERQEWVDSKNLGIANELEGIPFSITRLRNLRKLSFSGFHTRLQPNDILYLGRLTTLKSLDLNFVHISDIGFLEKLKELEVLDLSLNKTSNLTAISKLTKLTTLNLSYNGISDINFLLNLTELHTLYLRFNKIFDISVLSKLEKLQTLYLNDNQINDISYLSNLKCLKILNLSQNKINNLNVLSELKNLETLYLRSNQIKDLNFLSNLKSLKILSLKSNQINDIGTLKELTSLQTLDLCSNEITDIKPIANLLSLENLNIQSNLIHDISPLYNLKLIQRLNLHSNKISNISFLSNLSLLTCIDLSFNQISDITPLSNIKTLQKVQLGHNHIKDIKCLSNLTSIKKLELNSNQIDNIGHLSKLKSIQTLKLTYNNINNLMPIRDLILSAQEVSVLEGNHITTPPPEIIRYGWDEVVQWFREIEKEGIGYLYEAKLLIVGEARVGKTTLREKYKDQNAPLPSEKETTHGIDIFIDKEGFTTGDDHLFITYIWDFGGQAVYHSTHQFFLTRRSLYIVVDDSSRDDVDLDYWFQVIENLTDNSPVILLQNQKNGRVKDIGFNEIRKRYENIKEFFEIDLALIDQHNSDKFRLFKKKVQSFLEQLPLVGMELPKTWVYVRKELNRLLEEEKLAYISEEKYIEVCNQHGITEDDRIGVMSHAFHDIGVFLFFMDNPILSKIIILENEWATKAVYHLLTDSRINIQHGRFNMKDVRRIWNEDKYKSKHFELLELMKMFELIYELPNNRGQEYIATQLLPNSRPDYNWDYKNNLRMVYVFPFLPKGLISRFIVRMNRFIIDVKNFAWRKGVVLQRNNSQAEIKEIYGEKKIEIRLKGIDSKELLTIIIDDLDQLRDSYNNLPAEKLIPCICKTCKARDKKLGNVKDDIDREKLLQPYFYKQSDLNRRLAKNKFTVECEISYDSLDVQSLLDNLYRVSIRKESSKNGVKNKSKIFISYSSKDKEYLDELEVHLAVLERNNLIETWQDRKLMVGEEWDEKIKSELNEADIIIFLVSSDFLATDYIWDEEIKLALERHENHEAVIFPIIIRDCMWESTPFAHINIADKALVIGKGPDRDSNWKQVAILLKELITK